MANRAAQRQLQNAIALQNNQQRGYQQLEQLRNQGDVYQQFMRQNPTAFTGIGPPQGITPELQQFEQFNVGSGDATASGQQAGPPASGQGGLGPIEEGVPLPSIRPELVGQYQRAKQELNQAYVEAAELQRRPGMAPEHRLSAMRRANENILQAEEMLKRYPQRKQPTTFQELVQQGGMMPIPGTMNFAVPDPSNGPNAFKVSSAVRPSVEAGRPWMQEPDPVRA